MPPPVEPHVFEGPGQVRIRDKLQQPFDVIGIDMRYDQELEVALIGRERGETLLQRRIGALPTTVDEDVPRPRRIAVLDPEAIAFTRREHINAEDAHFRLDLSLSRMTVNACEISSR